MKGVVLQQADRMARILAIDDVRARQNAQGPQRHVGEIADRRGDDVQARRQRLQGQALDDSLRRTRKRSRRFVGRRIGWLCLDGLGVRLVGVGGIDRHGLATLR